MLPLRVPSTFTMTAAGAVMVADPSGRPTTARRWFANCEVAQASIV